MQLYHVSSEVQPGGAQVGFIFASQSPHTQTTSKPLLLFSGQCCSEAASPIHELWWKPSPGPSSPAVLVVPHSFHQPCLACSHAGQMCTGYSPNLLFDHITPFYYIPPQAPLFSNPSYTSNLSCWFLFHSSPSSSFL